MVENKNNFVYEIECSKCETMDFGGILKCLLKCDQMNTKDLTKIMIVKRMKSRNTIKGDHNFSWDQKKVVNRESRVIPRKIKETLHPLKNPNYINKISYLLLGV